MSCQHGNSIGHCDICDEVDAAWKAGEASGKRSAEHCTCPACRITHTNCCAVHNMPAMPIGHCDCGAIPPPPVRSVSDEDVAGACDVVMRERSECAHEGLAPRARLNREVRAALEHFAAIAQEKQS